MADLDTKAHEAFTVWCFERYAKRSARKLSLDVRTMVVNDGVPPESQQQHKRLRDYVWAWDVWHDWAAESGAAELPIPRPVRLAKPRGSARRSPKRLHEALSLPDEIYLAFVKRVAGEPSDPRAAALHVISRTGLRVSDLMRIELAALKRAFKREDGYLSIVLKGGKEVVISVHSAATAWRAIGPGSGELRTVADWVMGAPGSDTEAGGAAYERLDKYIRVVGAFIAPAERWHIHRLRRTVAMRLLDAGESIEVVRDVLGHSDIRTTRTYTDESRAKAAARALAKLGEE